MHCVLSRRKRDVYFFTQQPICSHDLGAVTILNREGFVNQFSHSISVAMCTFNGALYLEEQLQSIAAQTRPPNELVICDDCSSDETLAIIEDFARHASFPVHVHRNEQNLGSTRNFEKATRLCTGDLIAFADQDDVWKLEKLHLFELIFAKRPDVGVVFTDAEIVDENLQAVGQRMWKEIGFGEREKQLIRKGRAVDVLLPGWTVTGATMAFRAKFRNVILPIPTDLPMIHDGWTALMVAAVSDVSFIEEPLVLYRQHQQQQIGAPATSKAELAPAKKIESIRSSAQRKNSYSDLVKITRAVLQRIAGAGEHPALRQNTESLNHRLSHLNVRMSMPQSLIARLGTVSKELMTMRYHRYSNGIASAVKDLWQGGKEPG
jgi:glycosyltransferase involved in cell wall biosynthesis